MLIKLSTDKTVGETAAALQVALQAKHFGVMQVHNTESGKMVKIQEAENQITTLIRPSLPVLDICDHRFFCRMAKKLGCQFCAK